MKLQKLISLMQKNDIDAFIVPSTDPHQSEYIANYWKNREWLTGFTGSAGTAVVTQDHAGLWTDSRYFIQAEKELTPPFKLHKLQTRTPEYINWIIDNLNSGDKIGIDGQLFSAEETKALEKKISTHNLKLVLVNDFFTELWEDRPELPQDPIFIHESKFTGTERSTKINEVLKTLNTKKASHILISTLDDIAWVLNIRGNDIEFNPVAMAYCLVSEQKTTLFIDPNKVPQEISKILAQQNIAIKAYHNIFSELSNLPNKTSIYVNETSANSKLISSISSKCQIKTGDNIVAHLKAIKSDSEIENYKQAQISDGLAMCNLLSWLDENIQSSSITELDVVKKAEEFRSAQPNYQGLSFGTISAYGHNAALPHYTPSSEHNKILEPKGMYLIDSGGQYLNGTTDITRTVALGEVTQEEIDDYTLVLKGHIKISAVKFPHGTNGFQLDILARMDMWQHGKDFGHGTGHGIGHYLNVHEGPQGFSTSISGVGKTIIETGMLITNEPGLYFEGKHGIRIENVILCTKFKENNTSQFLQFETLTLCPFDKKLINKSMLSNDEIDWINSYHKSVLNKLAPLARNEVKDWIVDKTSTL